MRDTEFITIHEDITEKTYDIVLTKITHHCLAKVDSLKKAEEYSRNYHKENLSKHDCEFCSEAGENDESREH